MVVEWREFHLIVRVAKVGESEQGPLVVILSSCPILFPALGVQLLVPDRCQVEVAKVANHPTLNISFNNVED